MDVQFLEPARIELDEAVRTYNSQRHGLGYAFADEVWRTIGRIIEFPEAWALLSKRTRRCRTNRFPYGIIYQIQGDTLLVIAVMHLHREPQSWRKRIGKGEQ